jgi:hypothetical protein
MADLITLEEYKEQEGITSPKDDLRLNRIIPSVSQLVKTYCGNSILDFYSTNKVETFNIEYGTNLIQLTESPLNTVISVEERGNPTESYVILDDTTDFYVDTTTDSIMLHSRNFKKGYGAVKVTYTAGYPECPEDLKLAVYDLVTYYLKDEHKERKTLGGATVQNQASTTQRNNVAFPDHIKRVLDLYKNF